MIPKKGWKSLDTAPRDGTIFIAKYCEFGKPGAPERVHAVQWLCDEQGKNWTLRKPWHFGTTHYADAWMTYEEFQAAQIAQEAPPVEFDL